MNRSEAKRMLSRYVFGYIASIALTITAYAIATSQAYSTALIALWVSVLALVQFAIQLVAFLHLGRDREGRWQLYAFFLMIVIVLILVGGSYWIMNNLNYNMMHSPHAVNTYLNSQDGF